MTPPIPADLIQETQALFGGLWGRPITEREAEGLVRFYRGIFGAAQESKKARPARGTDAPPLRLVAGGK